MQKETQVIHWVDHKEEKVPECRNNRSHSDPTANEAIGNVMREERRKEKEKMLKELLPPKQLEFDRLFKAGNRPELKDILSWFGNDTILHIGSRSAFYFIGTAKELKKDMAFVESNMQPKKNAVELPKRKAVPVLKRKVIEVYSKIDPSEGVIIKTEGSESGNFWFGLTWSLELYQQTNARLWRQGQTHVVTIHHIITKNTVDEDVMAALEQKDMTQEKLISAVKAQLGV